MENDKDQNTLCCPNCGSTALSTDKKGFGTGKFVAGTLIAGPLAGVLAGGIGKNKREVYCLKCGRKYTPGSTFNGLVTVKQYNSRKKLEAKMKASGEDKEIIAYGCGTCCAIIAFIFFIIAISNKTTELMAFGGFLVILTIIFFVSAKKEPYGFSDLENKLTVAKLLIKEGLFPFSLNEFEDSVEKWKKSGYPAVRHSESFRTHYHPSYRVISNEYVQHLSLFAKADAAFIAGHQFITIDADLSENRKIREIFRYLYDGKLTLSDATPDEKI